VFDQLENQLLGTWLFWQNSLDQTDTKYHIPKHSYRFRLVSAGFSSRWRSS